MAALQLKGVYYDEATGRLLRMGNAGSYEEIAVGSSFTSYVGLVGQSGTGAPTASELENSVEAGSWTRQSAGVYRLPVSIADVNKVFFPAGLQPWDEVNGYALPVAVYSDGPTLAARMYVNIVSSTFIEIKFTDPSGSAVDNVKPSTIHNT
jgi:hypothetical protein